MLSVWCIIYFLSIYTEMYCHVHGPVYGCLEHCVPDIQLQVTEGKGSHVKRNLKKTFYWLMLRGRKSSVYQQRLGALSWHHCGNSVPSTSVSNSQTDTDKAEPMDSSHNILSSKTCMNLQLRPVCE